MHVPKRFLVVDDNADSRFLVVKTLLKKFPQSIVQECQDAAAAVAAATGDKLDAVVAHRAADIDGLSLIRELRSAARDLPIIMVSGIDRSAAAAEAGATEFLNYDQWQRIGMVVANYLPRTAQP